jgi:hypothetical protein
VYSADFSPDITLESNAAPFFNTVISLIPPGAFKDAFTVTVEPGIPAKVPEVLTVGAGKTSTSSVQLDNVPIRRLAKVISLIAFIDNRFIFVNCLNY